MNSNPTQAQAILARLRAARGDWVPMPELAACSGAYAVHSRIAELRRLGHHIPPPRITRRGRLVCTEYRLIEPPPPPALADLDTQQPSKNCDPFLSHW